MFPHNPTAKLLWIWESQGNLPRLPLSFPSCTFCLHLLWSPLPSPKSQTVSPQQSPLAFGDPGLQRCCARGAAQQHTQWLWLGPRSPLCPQALLSHLSVDVQAHSSSSDPGYTSGPSSPGCQGFPWNPRLVWVAEAHLIPPPARAGTPSLPPSVALAFVT